MVKQTFDETYIMLYFQQRQTRLRCCWSILSKLNLAQSIFIIGSVWPWNWNSTHINLNNVMLWSIHICKIFAKTLHCFFFCFFFFWGGGVRYSFLPFALTRYCALHLRPCEKTRKTYFAGGLAGFSQRYVHSLNKFYIIGNMK